VSLFDFLKGSKKKRRSGGRSAASTGRRTDQSTRQIPMPPSPLMNRNPSAVATAPADNRTIARTIDPSPVMPAPPPRGDAGGYAPPPHADSGQTQYIVTGSSSTSDIVGVLVGIDGELKGQLYRVGDGENRLGRGAECEIELNSQKISRAHAMLIHQDGMFVVKPLSEKNPTFLNEVPTDGDELGDGDTIRLGLTTLKFRSI
jgi:hypothetical protein